VIPGWDIGVMSMKEKGKREMIVSPELAYGRKATGPIPPNATLHFTVELDMITPTMWTHVGFITKKLF
jgi:FKBP-type peptidyl-prolyl cis-trans isomerase FkpA